MIVKNTFLEVVDAPLTGGITRSRSESNLSSYRSRSSASQHSLSQRSISKGQAPQDSASDGDTWPPGCPSNDTSSDASTVNIDRNSSEEQQLLSTDLQELSCGSAAHSSGLCKPCLYIHARMGCLNGADCRFCHVDSHPVKHRVRPCKAKRTQCKNLLAMLDTVFGSGTEQYTQVSEALGAKSAYMRTILKAKASNSPSGQASLQSGSAWQGDSPRQGYTSETSAEGISTSSQASAGRPTASASRDLISL